MATPRNCYLNDSELDALERLSAELDYSASGVLRLGLRLLAGLPVPSRVRHELGLLELGKGDPRREATPLAR